MRISRRSFLAGATAAGAAVGGGRLSASSATEPYPTPERNDVPIDHIVVLAMENRSFDHYFGSLELLEGRSVDGLAPGMSNPWSLHDGSEGDVEVFRLGGEVGAANEGSYCQQLDPPHEWHASRTQYADGTNAGYLHAMVERHGRVPGAENVMGYYTRADLPFFYGAADQFVLCNRWFSPVGGPTLPNRHYLHAASSHGVEDNRLEPAPSFDPGNPVTGFPWETIYDRLDAASLDWGVYYVEAPFTMLYRSPRDAHPERFRPYASFVADAAAGTLPAFVTIDPGYFTASDHSPQNVQLGQLFVASVYNALASSPALGDNWVLFVTYDEDGGFFDHVPHAFFPDERGSVRVDAFGNTSHVEVDLEDDFSKSGGRLPGLVISPYARRGDDVPGTLYSTPVCHASVLAFTEWRHGLAPLSMRDHAALIQGRCFVDDLVDPDAGRAGVFDFDAGPRAMPTLPVPSVNPSRLHECVGTYVGPSPSLPLAAGGTEATDAILLAATAGVIPMEPPDVVEDTLRRAFAVAEVGVDAAAIGELIA